MCRSHECFVIKVTSLISVTYSCPDRRTRDTWELFSLCYSQMSTRIVPSTINPAQNPVVQPGVSAAAALPPLSLMRSCAAGRATAPASPRLLCSRSSCYVALCWRPSFSTGTLCLHPTTEARPPPFVTVPTDSTSAGGLGFHPMTVIKSFPAAACGESERSTRARTDSTAASDLPGWRPCRPALTESCERSVSALQSRDSPTDWPTNSVLMLQLPYKAKKKQKNPHLTKISLNWMEKWVLCPVRRGKTVLNK